MPFIKIASPSKVFGALNDVFYFGLAVLYRSWYFFRFATETRIEIVLSFRNEKQNMSNAFVLIEPAYKFGQEIYLIE